MMPASKHGDPQLGVDIHLCVVPPSPSPVPLPTPHMSVVFDPFDYVPIIGATISVCGMKRATAGTSGIAVHIPPGFPFAPMLPQKDDELFMGSATVVADGDPFSYIALPVLSCQVAGMPSIPRLRKKGPKKMMLGPLVFNLAIPSSVFVGGPPTISLMGMAMKGAFAGLGKLAKSGVFKRMRQKLFKNMSPGFLKCTILRAEPVNILSGAVSVEHEDFVLPGRIPIEWRRVYGSDNRHAGHCGHGWETPADARLEINHDGVVMQYPGVGPLHFNGVPVAEGEAAAELELQDGAVLTDVDDEYRVRTKEDRIYHFAKRSMVRRPDGGQSIALSKIADLCGNHLHFERHGGVLTAIHESAGRRLEFRTDAGRIQRIGLVTPESPERHAYVRYDYDAAGDLVAVRDALDQPYTFGYDAHHMVRHTDRNGLSFYYEYDAATAERRVVHAWGDGGLYDYRFEYSDVLKERRITDSLGNISIVKLNEQGLPINEIDALGGVTIYEYDAAGRTVGVTDQDGHRTGHEYDARGNLLTLTRADGTTLTSQFDELNKATVVIDPNQAQWQQVWDERGLLREQVTPSGHRTKYEYDSYGQLLAATSPGGGRTEARFDIYGNVARISDALGRRTRFGHDELGNVTGKLDPLSNRTLYAYDAKSRLTQVQLPSGAQLGCDYDAADNLIAYVDQNGARTRFEYFGQGQIAKKIQPDAHTVEYLYDTEERLVGLRNQRGELYRLQRDALGRVIEEIDYWGQSRRYGYSPGGQLRESIDPLHRRVLCLTDPLGRLLKRILPHPHQPDATFEEVFEYDGNGNLIAAANPTGRIERSLDPEGRIVEEKQGAEFTLKNAYDANGNRIARVTQAMHGGTAVSHQVRFTYDLAGQIAALQIDEHAPVQIERNAAGQVIAEQLSPDLRREIEYSADGWMTRQRVRAPGHDVLDIGYSYDAVGNLTERRDAAFGVERFIYDPLGRITQHIDPESRVRQYVTDAVGERWQSRLDAAAQSSEWWREAAHEGARYRFDRAGNLIERRDERGTLLLGWDANQRLVSTRLNGITTLYEYDPLGRRVTKRTDKGSTLFNWDEDALLADVFIAASSGAAPAEQARQWVYFPETFQPLALLAADGSVHHYHTDMNGAAVRLTDAHGTLTWAANYDVWGGIAKLHSQVVPQPLRLQGQYADEETGLHYNLNRYYDPRLGEFISKDPLSVAAGPGLYQFAVNTKSWIDPLGLTCKPGFHYRPRTAGTPDPGLAGFVSDLQARGVHVVGSNLDIVETATGRVVGEVDVLTRHAAIQFKDGVSSGQQVIEQVRKKTEPFVDVPVVAFINGSKPGTARAADRTARNAGRHVLATNDMDVLAGAIK